MATPHVPENGQCLNDSNNGPLVLCPQVWATCNMPLTARWQRLYTSWQLPNNLSVYILRKHFFTQCATRFSAHCRKGRAMYSLQMPHTHTEQCAASSINAIGHKSQWHTSWMKSSATHDTYVQLCRMAWTPYGSNPQRTMSLAKLSRRRPKQISKKIGRNLSNFCRDPASHL